MSRSCIFDYFFYFLQCIAVSEFTFTFKFFHVIIIWIQIFGCWRMCRIDFEYHLNYFLLQHLYSHIFLKYTAFQSTVNSHGECYLSKLIDYSNINLDSFSYSPLYTTEWLSVILFLHFHYAKSIKVLSVISVNFKSLILFSKTVGVFLFLPIFWIFCIRFTF